MAETQFDDTTTFASTAVTYTPPPPKPEPEPLETLTLAKKMKHFANKFNCFGKKKKKALDI